MPDWQAWPFPTEDPYPAYRLARARAPVQWKEQLGAHLVLSDRRGALTRDPARYPDPDRLDLTRRTGTPHLAFGGGPHFCVGAGLARLEAQETFKRIAQSLPRPETGNWSHTRDRSRTFRRVRTLDIGASILTRDLSPETVPRR